MPDQGDVSTLLRFIREDLAAFRQEVNARLDKLVSQDAFEAERRRVDERHAALQQDLMDERAARIESITAERVSREAAIRREREAREAAHKATDDRSRKAWSVVRWLVGTMIATAAVAVSIWAVFVR